MSDVPRASGAAGPPPPSVSTLRAGTVVGGYELLRRLGAGGMGVVWEARDGGGQRVAMKILHPQIAADPVARRRLDREARVLGRVKDARVARILDIEAAESDLSFVITEFVDGPTLQHEVDQQGPYDLATDARELSDLAHGIVGALRAVHAAHVIHRDLKPSNVMLGSQGPVLIDFGIAQVADDARLTQTGQVTGTPGFIPPEMLDGGTPSEGVDWYACAGVLLFTLTGRAPFGSGSWQTVFRRVYAGTPEVGGLETAWPALAQAFTRALAPEAQDRLDTEDLLAVIDEIADGGTGETALVAAVGEASTETGTFAGSYGYLPATVPPESRPAGYGMAPRSPGTGGWDTGAQRVTPAAGRTSGTAQEQAGSASSAPSTAAEALPPAVPVGAGSQIIPPHGPSSSAPGTGSAVNQAPGRPTGYPSPPTGVGQPVAAPPPGPGPRQVPAVGAPVHGLPAVIGGVPDWAQEPARHPGMVLAWAVALVAVGALRPGWVAIGTTVAVAVLGAVGRAEDARRWTRLRRGTVAAGDTSRMWAASPWYLLRSALAAAFAALTGGIAAVAVFYVMGARAMGYGGAADSGSVLLATWPEPLRAGVLCAVVTLVFLVVVWFTPWNAAGRRGAARAAGLLAPSGPIRVVHVLILLVVAVSVVVLLVLGRMPVSSFTPLVSV